MTVYRRQFCRGTGLGKYNIFSCMVRSRSTLREAVSIILTDEFGITTTAHPPAEEH